MLQPVSELYQAKTGQTLPSQTISRWVYDGRNGVRLQAIKVRGAWCQEKPDFDAFLHDSTQAAIKQRRPEITPPAKTRSIARKAKAFAKAESELSKAGI